MGSAGKDAAAWVKRIDISFSPYISKVKAVMAFSMRHGAPLQTEESPDITGEELYAHGLSRVARQTRSSQLFQGQAAADHTDTGMVFLARDRSASQEQKETSARSNKASSAVESGKKAQATPGINPAVVADKVYRLMQHDLILERERVTRLGG